MPARAGCVGNGVNGIPSSVSPLRDPHYSGGPAGPSAGGDCRDNGKLRQRPPHEVCWIHGARDPAIILKSAVETQRSQRARRGDPSIPPRSRINCEVNVFQTINLPHLSAFVFLVLSSHSVRWATGPGRQAWRHRMWPILLRNSGSCWLESPRPDRSLPPCSRRPLCFNCFPYAQPDAMEPFGFRARAGIDAPAPGTKKAGSIGPRRDRETQAVAACSSNRIAWRSSWRISAMAWRASSNWTEARSAYSARSALAFSVYWALMVSQRSLT
ncbi:MAG: hypothetical protein RL091_2178 [Verrucomicrobiota bacterium]